MTKTFYITTPIYYPNANPHMGHAYTSVLCDVVARYHRLLGEETYFTTGTDENASKVGEAAEAAGKTVDEFTDDVVDEFKALYQKANVSYNHFVRTNDKESHWPGVIEMWKRLEKAGDIYKDTYEGLYCTGCESFKIERELENGNCPDHGRAPQKVKEENYFFRLSKYADDIKKAIESGEFRVEPESRKKEILSFIERGVEDVSFSRPKELVPWGVPVPGDDSQVMYVWCDALTNYISVLGFGREDDELFEKFWPANYHVVGKDIIRFHTLIWPAMLLSAGVALPKAVFAHGFIISGGKKMSKTLGNVLDPNEFLDEYGTDALRYYLARHVSPTEDGDMTHESFKEAYNANLANGIGNLTSRIMKMVEQYEVDLSDLMLPSVHDVLEGEDVQEYHEAFGEFRPDKAADVVWGLIGFMDNYIADTKPFKTIKEDESKAHSDILFLVERLWEVAVLLEPFIPDASDDIKEAIQEGKMPKSLFERKE